MKNLFFSGGILHTTRKKKQKVLSFKKKSFNSLLILLSSGARIDLSVKPASYISILCRQFSHHKKPLYYFYIP